MEDIYKKLSYVPLPNLKKCLKERLKDDEKREKVDNYTKSEVIAQFRILNLKLEDIISIYKQYKFGKNLSFQLFYANKNLSKMDFSLDKWKDYSTEIDLSVIKYENLPRIKGLQFTDIEQIEDNFLEVVYKYHSLHKYFKDNEREEPAFVYETQYGFLWINAEESYLIIISKDEKVVQKIREYLFKNFELKLSQPQLTKESINKIFLLENTKSATYTEIHGATTKISYPSTAKEYEEDHNEEIRNIFEQIENNGIRKANAKYKETIAIDENDKSVISVNADKCRISILKTYSTDEIRKWGKSKFSQITNELKNIKQQDITEYFDIFSNDILQGYRFKNEDILNIKLVCRALYNAIKKQENCEISNVELLFKNTEISKYFHILPLYDCPSCEETHEAKCYTCGTKFEWKNGLYCPSCKSVYTDHVFLKCENGKSNELEVTNVITLIPKSNLINLVERFIAQANETFNIKNQNFYIKNNKLYYFHNISNTEVSIKDISLFKEIDLNLQFTNPDEYNALKQECINIPEKCKNSCKTNCSGCLNTNERFCLMKMLAYIAPSYKPQPHKGNEYGDASFTAYINGEQKDVKFIMKSAEKDGMVLATTKSGKEFIIQLVTQYLRDEYKPILVILTPSQIDAYLKADMRNIVRYKNGKIIFIEEKELVAIYKLAKENGFCIKIED